MNIDECILEWKIFSKSILPTFILAHLSFQFPEVVLVLFLRNSKVLWVEVKPAGKPSEPAEQELQILFCFILSIFV